MVKAVTVQRYVYAGWRSDRVMVVLPVVKNVKLPVSISETFTV